VHAFWLGIFGSTKQKFFIFDFFFLEINLKISNDFSPLNFWESCVS